MLRVGDLVERINGANGDIPEGTQAKISEINEKEEWLKLEGYEARGDISNYVKIMDSEISLDEIINTLKNIKHANSKSEINKYERRMRNIENTIENKYSELTILYKDLKEIMLKIKIEQEREKEEFDVTSEINSILEHPSVEKIQISGENKITIFTKNIDIYDEEGRKYRGNRYKIRFNYENMNCKIFGLDKSLCRKSYWSERDPHPHVSGNGGTACWGDAGSMLTMNMNEYELYASYIVVYNFLQQVNTSDPAGACIRNWDCIDDEGNIIDNPHSENVEYCCICEEEMTEDEWYCCEDCGDYACGDHIQWIDSLNKYVCENCRYENYTYCDDCGDWFDRDDITSVDSGNAYCDKCLDYHASFCDNCQQWCVDTFTCEECGKTYCSDCEEDEGDGLCEECREKQAEEEEETC